MKKNTLLILFLFLLVSCSHQSLEDYRDEGRGVSRNLIKELQRVRTRDQLKASTGKLQKLFNKMADTMVAAQEQRQKNPNQEIPELTKVDHDLSDSLRFELNRIYTIEGGRALIEKCQEQALERMKTKDEG